MRTTIDLTDEQRSELLRLAARRGLKGFSPIVQEAVDAYLKNNNDREKTIGDALALRGSLNRKSAEAMRRRVRILRENWR